MSLLSCENVLKVAQRSTLLYSMKDIEAALNRMAAEITEDLKDKQPLVLCVMTGGMMFTSAILMRLDFPLQVDYIHATRYQGEIIGSTVKWLAKPALSLKDREVLIMDDILDGGITLSEIVQYCYQEGAKSVKTAVLIEKKIPRLLKYAKHADYVGIHIENQYIYGYGMDYKHYFRNTTGIFAVAKEDE